jgi:hypothetical protein
LQKKSLPLQRPTTTFKVSGTTNHLLGLLTCSNYLAEKGSTVVKLIKLPVEAQIAPIVLFLANLLFCDAHQAKQNDG